ncbi:MAG: DUF4268 domain-containing protein [Planctomycetaceae bacterium]|nr:DUF4268 domain-containing protein [Planctomycetaceae bacterium]
MALYEIGNDSLRVIEQTTFVGAKLKERDVQRLLRTQIEVLDPDLYVLAEEFSEWQDSSRRIDLLAIDRDAQLVVIELKRTEDGGHMELQALRYAAMVSAMTWQEAVEAHREYLQTIGVMEDAEERILSFLDWTEARVDDFGQEVRIVLASANFSRELTTSVLWLIEKGVDIRCIRMMPYFNEQQLLLDVQQVIPLPEAADYQVRLQKKAQEEQSARREDGEKKALRRKFWDGVLELANKTLPLHEKISSSPEAFLSATNGGIQFCYIITNKNGRVELNFKRTKAENKAIFDELFAKRVEIEAAFGGQLDWQRQNNNDLSKICSDVSGGGLPDEDSWPVLQPRLVDAMKRLFDAMNPYVQKYREGADVELPSTTETPSA